MNILIFIIVLCVLILVHELGHFLFAKLFHVQVDEFGFGYPPRILKLFSWKGTDFTLNWLPFGGFVRILGEETREEKVSESKKNSSLIHKARWKQILIMFAGILFNIFFAWILFSGIFMSGVETSIESGPTHYEFKDSKMLITNVKKDSPAFNSGLKTGDIIREYYRTEDKIYSTDLIYTKEFISFVQETPKNNEIHFVVQRQNGSVEIISLVPEQNSTNKASIGISVDNVGELKLGFFKAFSFAAKNTLSFTKETISSFWKLLTGRLSFDNVSGPVGIANQVGQIAKINVIYLISFAAMLSINLAVLNLIPFPALDGGRILILIIESIIQKRINPNITNWINGVGFFALIILMVFITIKDVISIL